MSTIEWIVLGAALFAIILFCARLTRKGLSTLEDARNRQNARIADENRKIAEDRKNMSAHEHLTVIYAGIEDLLRLDGLTDKCDIKRSGYRISIVKDGNTYTIELLMRERMLKSTHKVIHGRNLWLLEGPDLNEMHKELTTLMASLERHLKGQDAPLLAPDHIKRRIGRSFERDNLDIAQE